MIGRRLLVLATAVVALAAPVLAGTPAAAAQPERAAISTQVKVDWHGCAAGDACGFGQSGFRTRVFTYRYYVIEAHTSGINLGVTADDNTRGVVNRTGFTLIICQHDNLKGFCWPQYNNTAWDYAGRGWWVSGRASSLTKAR